MAACDRTRKPAKTNGPRLRFSFQDGLDLLREVRATNAVQDLSQWTTVKENVARATGKAFSLRAVRDHFDLLLAQYKRDDRANLQKGVSVLMEFLM
ncbi:hypothetical protein HPB48_026695 [Haemaphysalis longicornis]|uniref:Uncharacterized protein n=1 Tax=Haemaphysalis longicornis TaxID=44386 RepID=A0A9J6HCH2_HAELO|nr:hypothetical protein HPB48_026695 [Haemaphysalis longicornis]